MTNSSSSHLSPGLESFTSFLKMKLGLVLFFSCLFFMKASSEAEYVTVCEGETAELECPEDYQIRIDKVFYGRANKYTCHRGQHTELWDTRCFALSATKKVMDKCDGKSPKCLVASNNGFFGDPCHETPKYLEVYYECLPASTTIMTTTTTTTMTTTTTKITTTSCTTTTTMTTASSTISTALVSPIGMHITNEITSELRIGTKYCSHTQQRNIYWPQIPLGGVARLPCPNNKNEVAKWKCHEATPSWVGLPNMTDCVSPVILSFNILLKIKSLPEIKYGFGDLLDYLASSDSLLGNDIDLLINSFYLFVKDLEDLLNKLDSEEDRNQMAISINEGVVNMSSILLSSNHLEVWQMDLLEERRHNISSDMIYMIEETAFIRTHYNNQSFNLLFPNLEIDMRVVDVQQPVRDETFYDRSREERNNQLNEITLSAQSIKQLSKDGVANILFASYSNLGSLLSPHVGTSPGSLMVGTRVVSASVNGRRDHVHLVEPVMYSLEHVANVNLTNPSCSYWSFPNGTRRGEWLSDGCEVVDHNWTHTTCRCNHLTNFAVLMTVSGQMDHVTDKRHAFVLSMITYFGCIISIIALLASFLVFTFVRSIQCRRNTIHKNLVMCLCISEFIFLIGISSTSTRVLCSIIALCLHFFFLCTFSWMFLEGVQLYIMLIQVFVAKKPRVLWYYIASYGMSSLIVILSASVNFKGYGTKYYCWLSRENGFIWAFVGPVCAIIAINMIFLGMAIFVMCKHTYFSTTSKVVDKGSVSQISSWVKGLATLVVLLGLTWFFGLLYIDQGTIVMAYLFTIVNSFQGLFIFIFHCLLNEKVQKAFKRRFSHVTWTPSCFSAAKSSTTSSSSHRASSLNNINLTRFLVKKKSSSTYVPASASSNKSYLKKMSFSSAKRSSSSSVQPPSSFSLISPHQHFSDPPYFPQQNDDSRFDDSSPNHIYSEPTLDDPSAYLDPTQIRIDPDEERAWAVGYSHLEGSVADTDYLDDCKQQRTTTNTTTTNTTNTTTTTTNNVYFNDEKVVEQQPPEDHNYSEPVTLIQGLPCPRVRLDVKKYQLRRPEHSSQVRRQSSDTQAEGRGGLYEEIYNVKDVVRQCRSLSLATDQSRLRFKEKENSFGCFMTDSSRNSRLSGIERSKF